MLHVLPHPFPTRLSSALECVRVAAVRPPGQVARPRHDLAVLHTGELGEGAVGRLVAPDALRRREHRVAAVALLVVAVVLIAVDHDLVADLPALHLGADGPDHTGGDRKSNTSELQSLMRISYAVFCLKQKSEYNNN